MLRTVFALWRLAFLCGSALFIGTALAQSAPSELILRSSVGKRRSIREQSGIDEKQKMMNANRLVILAVVTVILSGAKNLEARFRC